ncbi:MAG: hypothetical protein C4539_04440 [Ignavibacteriales bacterium]|nr:MAG: hypothetical protein C4539_04440 [Ignavibacteriales bacterium]
MNREVIVEEGIVVSVENEFANVAVTQSETCNECSAKIICKPKTADENIIKVFNGLEAKPGDKVRFEIKGSTLLSASFMLYGLPLIIFLAGIFLGLSIFSIYNSKELYAFLFSVGLVGIYFFLSFGKTSKTNKEILPKILSKTSY